MQPEVLALDRRVIPGMSDHAFASFELHDTKTSATVWSRNYTRAVTKKDVSAVVAGIDRNVHRGFDEIAGGLYQYSSSVNTRRLANHARAARAREGQNPIRRGR